MTNLKNRVVLLSVLLVGVGSVAYAADTAETVYKNQNGSVLKLQFDSKDKNSGSLSGTFTTAVGNCKADINVPVPITGFYNGNAVSISINFPHCKQVVAMTGNFNKNNTQLTTFWLDTGVLKNSPHKDWNANTIGVDAFQKVAAKAQ